MINIQNIILVCFFLYSFTAFFLGLKNRKNPFGLTPQFNLISAFVWVDTIVFGAFFTLVSLICLTIQDYILFWLIFAVFWTIRSIGEQMYWFHEQFTLKHRNPPSTLWPSKFFKGEEVWIIMQIVLQCISVVSIIGSVYLFSIWLE